MAKLNKKEQAWIDDLQALLNRCPSNRIGFYTVGDPQIGLYDKTKQAEIDDAHDDLVSALNITGHGFNDTIDFPDQVHSVCG